MKFIGDYRTGDTIYTSFNTRGTDGAPITLAGSPAARVYKGDDTTEDDSGITLSVDFDSRTGHHVITIDTSADGTFYAAGADFRIVLTAGTADSISVVGVCVAEFSIENRSSLMPATAGRKLTVELDGMAHADVKEILGVPPAMADTDKLQVSVQHEAIGMILKDVPLRHTNVDTSETADVEITDIP